MQDYTPPHSTDHEQGVIASCLMEEDGYFLDEAIQTGIKVEDFFDRRHQEIYAELLKLHEANKTIDEINLSEALKTAKSDVELETIFAIQSRLEVSSPEKIREFCKVVIDRSKLRQLIRLSRETIEQAVENVESGEICAKIDHQLQRLTESGSTEFSMSSAVEEIKERLAGDEPPFTIPWGITSYDASLRSGGMKPGQIHVVAARPGKGKTTIALNVAGRVAREGHGVGFFSLEMGDTELVEKLIACAAAVDFERAEEKILSADEQKRFDEATESVAKWPLLINDETNMTPSRMKAIARNWKRKHDIKLIVLDYLQLMKGDDKSERRESQVADISRNMKCMAKELRVPIMVLAQLNRECEKDNRRPILSDLRESGAIEQDADSVTFLYDLEEDRKLDAPVDRIRWVRAKQRSGQSFAEGFFRFKKDTGRIGDLDKPTYFKPQSYTQSDAPF